MPLELQRELQVALGAAWDDELEPFRHASDDAPSCGCTRSADAPRCDPRERSCQTTLRLRRLEAPLPVVGEG